MIVTDNIKLKTKLVDIDIKLNGNKVIIDGDTASGKSFITNYISLLVANYKYNSIDTLGYLGKVEVFNYKRDNLYEIANFTGKLIIIDNADLIISHNKEYIDMINSDSCNQYIIIGRFLKGIRIAPHYIGHLQRTELSNGRIRLEMIYNTTERL